MPKWTTCTKYSRTFSNFYPIVIPGPKISTVHFLEPDKIWVFNLYRYIYTGGGKYGKYIFKTYNEIKIEAELLGRGLLELGLCGLEMHEGEEFRFLGLYSKNREEWLTADIASWHISATTVPLYDTLGSESKNFIIEQTQLRTIILSGENIEKILEERREGKCQSIKNLVAMDVVSEEEKKETEAHGISLFSMKEVMKSGETSHQSLIPCTTNSYANLCYTSGTTGDVKGALLTQRNITSACLGAHALPPYNQFNNKDAHCSYLPLAHVFEKIIVHVAILCGAKIGFYHGDIFKLSEDFQELKPSIILSVPRLFNRFYSVLVSKMGETKGFKRKLVDRALRIKTEEYRRSGGVTHKLYDALVFNKMRKAMGGKFWLMISGAAPIEGKVLEMLKICFCVPILEGYGQTENAAGGACSSIGDTIAGHIGAPFKCTEFKLVDIPEMDYYVTDNGIWKGEQVPMPRGEILMRGPANGRYFKNPQKTAETFIDGWLHTGDVGTFLPGGRIKIIDRKSNFFKLQQGEYIAPEKLENIYTMSPYVVQIFIYGDGFRSYLVAIVVLDPEYMKKVAEKMSNNY